MTEPTRPPDPTDPIPVLALPTPKDLGRHLLDVHDVWRADIPEGSQHRVERMHLQLHRQGPCDHTHPVEEVAHDA